MAADTEAAAAAAARQDPAIARALDRSRRVGGLLLKREQEELAAVEELAKEMISREYRWGGGRGWGWGAGEVLRAGFLSHMLSQCLSRQEPTSPRGCA